MSKGRSDTNQGAARDAVRSTDPNHHHRTNEATGQQSLQGRLTQAIRQALEAEQRCEQAHQQANSQYRTVAEVLIELRHAHPGVDGEPHDLRGRSPGYRRAVREAYAAIGAEVARPIPKRLTVGVSYWVRKLLLEMYGERRLAEEFGVVAGRQRLAPRVDAWTIDALPDDRTQCLCEVVGLLNRLVADPALEPTEELVRAAQRAVAMLLERLPTRPRAAEGLWVNPTGSATTGTTAPSRAAG